MLKIFSHALNKRVTIQRAIAVQSSKGVVLYEYPDDLKIESICAHIEAYAAFIVNGKAEKVSEIEHRITIRYRKNLNLHDRIIYRGRIFEQFYPRGI